MARANHEQVKTKESFHKQYKTQHLIDWIPLLIRRPTGM
jgi:hypothetical protein